MKSFLKNRSNSVIAILIGLFCAFLVIGLYLRTPLFFEELDLKLSDIRFKYREKYKQKLRFTYEFFKSKNKLKTRLFKDYFLQKFLSLKK